MPRERAELRSATIIKLHQIARMQLLDYTTEQIAQFLGCTQRDVADLIQHAEYAKIRDSLIGETYAPADEAIRRKRADTILQDASGDAAEALVKLLKQTDPKTGQDRDLSVTELRRVAESVLDRSGFGSIQRKAGRVVHALDPVTQMILANALEESHPPRDVEGQVIRERDEVQDGTHPTGSGAKQLGERSQEGGA